MNVHASLHILQHSRRNTINSTLQQTLRQVKTKGKNFKSLDQVLS